MLTTIRLGRTMYKIKPENEARVMEGYAKAAKIRRKPITAGCGLTVSTVVALQPVPSL